MENNNDYLVNMVNIRKAFGRVEALKKVDFYVKKGEVVGLVGDNGAGKSTLIKILVGLFPQTSGDIYFEGQKTNFPSPSYSRQAGIEVTYQGLGLIPLMSVLRNFFLGREELMRIGPFKLLNLRKMVDETLKGVHDVGVKRINNVNVDVESLSGGERQSICIGRAVHFGVKLLVLDEPTASLSINETEKVLHYVNVARERGLAVIFITHNIYHVHQVADRFVILEEGLVIDNIKKEDASPEKVIDIIAKGKELVVNR